MKLLAIDTTSNACSVAVGNGHAIYERHTVEARAHTTVLMPMIASILAEGGIAAGELDAVVLGNGPGSFIGMRIGASVAQGLCYAAGLDLIPVSSLAGIAAEAFAESDADEVLVAQDARMREIYIGHFRRGPGGLPIAASAERILPVGKLPIDAAPMLAAGGAWQKYPALLTANRALIQEMLPVIEPRARYLLGIATEAGRPIAPEMLEPAYLRTRVASAPAEPA